MYKGNMTQFVESLDVYLNKKHGGSRLIIGQYPDDGSTTHFVAFFAPGQAGAQGYKVYDTEDFERQVYDYVNNQLEGYVQGEYDGFFEQVNELSGEDVSGDESEDDERPL